MYFLKNSYIGTEYTLLSPIGNSHGEQSTIHYMFYLIKLFIYIAI